jgi:hypothetical protein
MLVQTQDCECPRIKSLLLTRTSYTMHPVKYDICRIQLDQWGKIGAELRGVSGALKPSLDKLSRENDIRISLYKYFYRFGLADGRTRFYWAED